VVETRIQATVIKAKVIWIVSELFETRLDGCCKGLVCANRMHWAKSW